ncbi:MAG TPA: ABC transporter substrate-binding protein [Micromonosporaceae bacterium]
MPQLDRRQVLKLFGAIAAAGVTGSAAACTSGPNGEEMEQPSGLSINVGLIAPALGPYSRIGAEITRGFRLYLDDHDGLLGRHQVKVKTAEEGTNADSAVAAAKSLLDGGDVTALVGLANPASLAAVAAVANQAKVPLVSSGASPRALTSPLFVWRAGYVEGEAGQALAPYAIGTRRRAYIMQEDTAASRVEADQFAAAYEDLGGRIVGSADGKVNYAARLRQAEGLGVDVIFAAYTGANAQEFLVAYQASGVRTKLVGPGSLTETADVTKLNPLPKNVYTAMYYAPDLDNEDNRRFVASYQKQHNTQASTYAMAAYDCAAVIDKGLRIMEGPPSPTGLNQAFSLLGQIDSPRGTWTFNYNRSPQQKWYLRKLRLDGQLAANLLDTDLAVLS